MADARLRAEWLGQMRFEDLSDAAWRVFTSALMWSVGNGTDGMIPKRHLRFLHPEGVSEAVRTELVAAALWSETKDGFVMLDWTGELGQSTAAQIDKYREDARVRQQRRRERAKKGREAREGEELGSGAQSASVTPNVTRDIPRDVTPNVGLGQGLGLGNGKGYGQEEDSAPENRVTEWPTRTPGTPQPDVDPFPGFGTERHTA